MVFWVRTRQMLVLSLLLVCVVVHAQGKLERDRPAQPGDEIGLTYEYVWRGASIGSSADGYGNYLPIRIEIDNPLNNDKGEVVVSSGTYVVRYPVELPSRSLRSFIVYVPVSTSYDATTITLNCDQARIKVEIDPFGVSYDESFDVGLVSDSTTLIAFLRSIEDKSDDENVVDAFATFKSYRDFAALPEKAPDRAIGYDGMDMVVLSEGAERLGDAQVEAIQRYVLAGGMVLFTGGAVSPILSDPRWAPFLPGTDPIVVNMEGSRVVSEAVGVPMTRTFSAMKITPAPGTTGLEEDGVPIFWYRQCGMGTTVFWAFDPFQSPFRTYAGRPDLFTMTLAAGSDEAEKYLNEIGASNDSYDEYSYYGGYSPYGYEPEGAGVFTVAMPPTSKIFLILGAFFICVVPLNFLLLAKLNRGHLAWFTSPVICLVFAGIFFMTARDLYGAELSRATSGVLLAHQGSPVAYVIGNQQLFFPAGGRYDLKLSGVEAITTGSDYSMSPFGGSDTGFSGDLYDIGEVVAPGAGVSNLSFREIHYRQRTEWPYRMPFEIELSDESGRTRVKGRFMNDTPFTLLDATVWIGHTAILLGDVEPGQNLGFDQFVVMVARSERYYDEPPFKAGHYGLTADISGFESGVTIGKEESTGTRLLYTFSESKTDGEDGS